MPGLFQAVAESVPASFVPPLDPEEPLVPLVPDVPLDPLEPDEPFVPEVPLVPEVPPEAVSPLLAGVGSVGDADSVVVGSPKRSLELAPLHAATHETSEKRPDTTTTPAVREFMKPEL